MNDELENKNESATLADMLMDNDKLNKIAEKIENERKAKDVVSKVTIEIDGQKYEFEGQVKFIQEHGLKKIYDNKGQIINIKHNGCNRIMLQAWNGCDTFESFVATEE